MTNITYKFATAAAYQEITELLSENKLPTEDIGKHLDNFITATDSEKIIGCIAVELHGTHGLLRSLVVDVKYRNMGIGNKLYNQLISFSSEHGVNTLHLLTNTAQIYFQRLGFSVLERTNAPYEIKSTYEFSFLCPSSSAYMTKDISGDAKFFKSQLHKIETDTQTNAKYWAVKSDKMMFTWFEVPPEKLFTEHLHESEQMTYVLSGELFFQVDNETHCLKEGDFISIPSNKPHTVWTEKKSAIAIDSWSPPNNNY